MRILHLNTESGFRGGERQVQLLALGLRERAHEQHFFALAEAPFVRRMAADGFAVTGYRKPWLLGPRSPLLTRRLQALAAEFRPDIVHAHTGNAHTLAVQAFLGKLPVVTTRRVDFAVKPGSRAKYAAPGQHFIAISTAIRDVLVAGGVPPDSVHLVPSGIDTGRVTGGNRETLRSAWLGAQQGPLVGFVGALVDHKAPWILAEAASTIRRRLPGARVVMVGEGPLRPRLEQIAAADPAALLLTGHRDDIADCYAAFDLFVMPSKLEGLCTALIDALAAGVPAIASRAGGIPDVVEDGVTGRLVPPLEAGALADAVVALWSDEAARRRFAENGRRAVETRFTAAAMVAGTEQVYRTILAQLR